VNLSEKVPTQEYSMSGRAFFFWRGKRPWRVRIQTNGVEWFRGSIVVKAIFLERDGGKREQTRPEEGTNRR